MNMCPDYNIINCLSQLGAIYYGATFFGVIGLFLTPWLIWQAFAKRPGGVPRFDENQKMKIVFFRVFSFVAACTYAVAAFWASGNRHHCRSSVRNSSFPITVQATT
jgi:hypothetical protein